MPEPMQVDSSFQAAVGIRVLVYGKYAGTVRYVSKADSSEGIGVELDRRNGDGDGELLGKRLFTTKPFHAVFVRLENLHPFSGEIAAACLLQSVWRKWRAVQKFRTLVYSHAWNVLDNNNEHLNLQRFQRLRGAELAVSQMAQTRASRSVSEAQIARVTVDMEYDGPHLTWPLKVSNVLEMLEEFKDGKLMHFKYVLEVLREGINVFGPLPTLQEIELQENDKMTVVGDLHGQLQDLFSIFSINGLPSATNKYLFNGDFVDRGPNGVEVVMTILCFKFLYPDAVFLNRGNHESRNQNSWMGFEDELWMKYSGVLDNDPQRPALLFERFQTLFESLPLSAVLQKKIFVVHGGLFSRDNVTLAQLGAISRKREPPLHQPGDEDRIFEDMLWSDPRDIRSRQPSERGAGVEFGMDVTNNFCLVNKIALVIRSHECVPEGYEILHGGRLITLFSASRYCGTQMNKGAFLTLRADLQPEIQQFYAHDIDKSTFKMQENLEDDTLRMIAERICDRKPQLFMYFTQHEAHQNNGFVSRVVWSEALRNVLELDLPFLMYQPKLADVDEATGLINYSRFLARYRIENSSIDQTGWQEGMIAMICKKLYVAMGAGDLEQAFKLFDDDSNGFIEYEEFSATLKKMDTGLSDQQVFELMRTADTNDDGRIDFSEFVQRFEVIFKDLHQTTSAHVSPAASPPPSPADVTRPAPLLRRVSSRDEQAHVPPTPSNIDVETMDALLQIGKALYSREGSLYYHFCHFDTNEDGVLQRSEFEDAIRKMGFAFSDALMARIMEAVDTDKGNSIDYKEFVTAFTIKDTQEQKMLDRGDSLTWQHSVLQQVSNVFFQHRIHIRNAFRMFDKTNTGVISSDEFRAGIKAFNAVLDSPLTDDQIEELLLHLDSNHDGVISYKEFLAGFRVADVRLAEEDTA